MSGHSFRRPLSISNISTQEIDRFYARLEADDGGCLIYTGPLFVSGYGSVWVKSLASCHYAHRVAWVLSGRLFTSSRPVLLHLCDKPACCLIGHLRDGTQQDNIADMATKKRGRRGSSGLPYGVRRRSNGKFQAQTYRDGWTYCVGTFSSMEAAAAAADAARQQRT